jgi:uncharacterized protein (TIGR00730 family)
MNSVCVFCGSSSGRNPVYQQAAHATGRALALEGLRLVYGGGRVGLMGVLADAALAAGGEVTGVIPRSLFDREIAHSGVKDMRVVGSMHERKEQMSSLADAFIALPGGAGTLEEIFEQWTWSQLGIHSKPCGFLNVNAYFSPLLAMVANIVAEGFMAPRLAEMLIIESKPEELLARFREYHAPAEKWRDLVRAPVQP